MLSTKEILNHMDTVYKNAGLDFIEALKVWKESRLSPNEIRDQIKFDTGRNIRSLEAKIFYRVGEDLFTGKEIYHYLQDNGADMIESRIKTARVLPFTPYVKNNFEKTGDSTYRSKQSSIDVEWVLVEKEGADGQKIMYLARREPMETAKKVASVSVLMRGDVQIDESGNADKIFPANCPGKGLVDDFLKTEDNVALCKNGNSRCKYFGGVSVTSSKVNQDITCKVK